MFVTPDKPLKIDIKGIQLVRRDSCAFVKDMCKAVLDVIMYQKDVDGAVAVARRHIADLLEGRVPLEKLTLSKALSGNYKNPNQPHVLVANKMRERGKTVPVGSRVAYVITRTSDPDCLQAEKAEDPEYAREHGSELDLLDYLEHQAMNPIEELLRVMVADPRSAVLDHEDVRGTWEGLRRRQEAEAKLARRVKRNALAGQREITEFFKMTTK